MLQEGNFEKKNTFFACGPYPNPQSSQRSRFFVFFFGVFFVLSCLNFCGHLYPVDSLHIQVFSRVRTIARLLEGCSNVNLPENGDELYLNVLFFSLCISGKWTTFYLILLISQLEARNSGQCHTSPLWMLAAACFVSAIYSTQYIITTFSFVFSVCHSFLIMNDNHMSIWCAWLGLCAIATLSV